jgi:hypothetical protein
LEKPRVLLMQPPIYDFALYDLFFKPYGLLRLGSWFERSGYQIDFLNCLDWQDTRTAEKLGTVKRSSRGTGKFFRQPAKLPERVPSISKQYSRYGIVRESIAEALNTFRPDLVCITTGMTYWYQGVIEAAEMIHVHAPQARLILGGIYATLMPEHAGRVTGADGVITGEADRGLPSLLARWGFPPLQGALPAFPLLLPEVWGSSAGVVRINTGCPLNCDYCASSVIDPEFCKGDPEKAFSFIEELNNKFGTVHVGFYDDALLVNRHDVLFPFLERAAASVIDWCFYTPNAVHINLIDREAAFLMKKAGFQEVRLGFESSSNLFHLQHDNKFTSSDFSQAVEALTSAGFLQHQLPVYVLAGLPGQTKREVEHSIREAAASGVSVSIAEFSPVPGTPAWEKTVTSCPYPIEDEPLFHNNSFQPTAWEGLTRDDMQELKETARSTRG